MSKQLSAQSQLHELIVPVITQMGYICWGIEYVTDQGIRTLRIYIDSPNGIEICDCEKVSRQLSALLDVENPIIDNYTLEVSSPGLDRPFFSIEQIQNHIGEFIQIKLKEPIDEKRRFSGEIIAVDITENCLNIKIDNELIKIGYQNIKTANLVPQY